MVYFQPFSDGCQPFRVIVRPRLTRSDNDPVGLTTIAVGLKIYHVALPNRVIVILVEDNILMLCWDLYKLMV